MKTPDHPANPLLPADFPEVDFDRSADGFPVARIGDITLAMLPLKDGGDGGFLASAWRLQRPLQELTRADFYGHEGRLADEAAFRFRVLETAEHKRDLATLDRAQLRMAWSTPWGASQHATVYAEGIMFHMTASHGGFKLSADRNAKIHLMLRSESGFYEEDEAWAAVARKRRSWIGNRMHGRQYRGACSVPASPM